MSSRKFQAGPVRGSEEEGSAIDTRRCLTGVDGPAEGEEAGGKGALNEKPELVAGAAVAIAAQVYLFIVNNALSRWQLSIVIMKERKQQIRINLGLALPGVYEGATS